MAVSSLLLVALGGALGSVLRYVCTILVSSSPGDVPLATLGVNILGSLVLGVLTGFAPTHSTMLLFGTGLCGGFTTYSAFTTDMLALAEGARPLPAVLYGGLSIIGGLAAAWLGILAGRALR
ncbi:MAG: CrcB family protein [Candidatus Kapabacteria bacterium]|nr:CrcB family protein [Candidatus Kapabacteria bacterium]